MIRTVVALLFATAIPEVGSAAEPSRLSIATDRQSYRPGEPIIISLVYCTESTGIGPQKVASLHPQAGYLSLGLTDVSTGKAVRSTAPVIARAARPPVDSVAPGECEIEVLDLIHWFGRPASDEAPMAKSLGLSAIPNGHYRVWAHLWGWIERRVECEFVIVADSVPIAEREVVERFVAESPGPGSTGAARERYCLKKLEELSNTRYWLFAYSHTGGLKDSIPLEQALRVAGAGEGGDARRARVLSRILRLPPEERRTIAARYDVPTEGRLVRFVARQIAREIRWRQPRRAP